MFKINFDLAFSKMDSDHLKAIGVDGNTLYLTYHKRKRAVHFENGFYISEAYDRTYSYIFPDKRDLDKVYKELTSNGAKFNMNKFKRDVRKYVPTRLGKSGLSVKREGEGLRGERF